MRADVKARLSFADSLLLRAIGPTCPALGCFHELLHQQFTLLLRTPAKTESVR